jgi:cytochrome P450
MNLTDRMIEQPGHRPISKLPPGPKWPAAVQGAEYWLAPGQFIERCARLGDRFTFRLPGPGAIVCVTHPCGIPFGGGVRRCLGGACAMLELRAILRTIPATRASAWSTPRTKRSGAATSS